MTSDVTEPQPPPVASHEDAEALLDAANNASQHVAVLHVAFMALCAYVLVIVFGTTDMDLLIDKGVKLPVVDVAVPIVGFYAISPYLVVLVHFNLLLQLQLLSRKLYAFDAAAPNEERIGGLRDRLHIFPFTYYLVGQPGPIMRQLLGGIVGTTLLALPLATLLVLQLRFLVYQHELITWAQRVAVWLDVALVVALWPVIMDRGDSWRDYLRQVGSLLRRWEVGVTWAAVWVAAAIQGFVTPRRQFRELAVFVAAMGLFKLLELLDRWWRRRRGELEDSIPAASPTGRGMPALLVIVALGVPFPLTLLVEGEWWEEKLLAGHVKPSEVYLPFRRLDFSGQVLLAQPAKPKLVAQLRQGDPVEVNEALKQVEGINLRWRSLRGANFGYALLPGANLRDAQLQGADLLGAELQGADLAMAQLQGADLTTAQLQGADLTKAELQGADLRSAELYGAIVENSRAALLDLQSAHWTPLEHGRLAQVRETLGQTITDTERKGAALERIERAATFGVPPPLFESCLIDPGVPPELNCEQKWLPAEVEAFRAKLFPVLEKLACESSWIAGGFMRQMPWRDPTSGRFGLPGRFAALLDKRECKGLSALPDANKDWIRYFAMDEEEERRRQSGAGKPAGDVPASPIPVPIKQRRMR